MYRFNMKLQIEMKKTKASSKLEQSKSAGHCVEREKERKTKEDQAVVIIFKTSVVVVVGVHLRFVSLYGTYTSHSI